jgi:transcriptional regulator with XRE-family HTH domain
MKVKQEYTELQRNKVAEMVRNFRKDLGISQTQFANSLEVSQSTISRLENSKLLGLKSEFLQAIADHMQLVSETLAKVTEVKCEPDVWYPATAPSVKEPLKGPSNFTHKYVRSYTSADTGPVDLTCTVQYNGVYETGKPTSRFSRIVQKILNIFR